MGQIRCETSSILFLVHVSAMVTYVNFSIVCDILSIDWWLMTAMSQMLYKRGRDQAKQWVWAQYIAAYHAHAE